MFRNTVKPALLTIGTVLGVFSLTGFTLADTHHDAHAKIVGKGDGKHLLHTTPQGHVAHAHVTNGKVKKVEVTHKGKAITLTKYKTQKKLHAMANAPGGAQFTMEDSDNVVNVFASSDGSDDTGDARLASAQLTMFVGWGFFNQFTNQWVVFWFPVVVVDGGDLGAIVFTPGPIVPPVLPGPVLNTNGVCPVGSSTSYNVFLQAGRTYVISLNTLQGGYDPYLWFYGPTGQLLAMDDDSGGFPNARIIYTPLVTGNYMITCGSFQNKTGGMFNLQVK
jgi:hypothetical protein